MSRALMVIADLENPGEWRPEATVEASVSQWKATPGCGRRSGPCPWCQRPAGDVVFVLSNLGYEPGLTSGSVEAGCRTAEWLD